MLKPSKCGIFCGFDKITTYCVDCPALMCKRCEKEMHKVLKHTLITFKNVNLKWNDKIAITRLFEDESFGLKVFEEVNRSVVKARIPNDEKRYEYEDNAEKWECEKCHYYNAITNRKCDMCCFFRVVVDHKLEYNSKLDKFTEKLLPLFVKLDDIKDAPVENAIHEYLNAAGGKCDFHLWFVNKYEADKSLSVINEVVELNDHRIGSTHLEERYMQIVKSQNESILKIVPTSVTEKLKNTHRLLEVQDLNANNPYKNDIINEVKEQELWAVIKNENNYTKRQKRMLITELHLGSVEKVQLLRAALDHAELGPYLKESCQDGNVKLGHLRQAIVDQILIDSITDFLKKECPICCNDYPMSGMQALMTCDHQICKNCLQSSLESMITSKYPCKWGCPACTDDEFMNTDKMLLHYTIKEILVDCKSSQSILDIFDEKLLSERLMGSPNFHWCANEQCEYGFEAAGLNRKVQCPACGTHMCLECNRQWKPEHENVTCQEYEMLMLRNDPNLAKILNDIGIECPKCRMRYALAPGGCLHFDCRTCGFKFCGGCYVEFTANCTAPNCRLGTGFHGHHPRNCIYFLRDHDSKLLEAMLKNVNYPKLENKPEKKCPFLIAEDKSMVNRPCDAVVSGTSGLCDQHYKEYLVQFINRNKIDPANFADVHGLNLMLFQGLHNQLEKGPNETEEAFTARLRKEVLQKCAFYVPKGLNADEAKP